MTQITRAGNKLGIGGASGELTAQVEMALTKSKQTSRPFFVVLIQIRNLAGFQSRRSVQEAQDLLRKLYASVRKAVHASQFVGIVGEGLAIVFDAAEPGQVDLISRRIVALCETELRRGNYNDLNSRWTDALFQIFLPAGGDVMSAHCGWAIYPRDGESAREILERAWAQLRRERAA